MVVAKRSRSKAVIKHERFRVKIMMRSSLGSEFQVMEDEASLIGEGKFKSVYTLANHVESSAELGFGIG